MTKTIGVLFPILSYQADEESGLSSPISWLLRVLLVALDSNVSVPASAGPSFVWV